jgi:acylphosphatase
MRRAVFHVSGKVQRNGFRSAVGIRGRALDLTGSVMNLPDGRAKVVVEAEMDRLLKFCGSLVPSRENILLGDQKILQRKNCLEQNHLFKKLLLY